MILVFYFHSIGYTPLSYSPYKFEWLIKNLLKKGFTSINLNDLNENYDINKRYVVFTFDDCLMDVFTNALPILLKYNFKGTFFSVPGYDNKITWGSIKSNKWSEINDKSYNIPFNYMGSNERKYLIESGMEVGAHTVNHLNLNELSIEDQKKEICDSISYLEKELNINIKSFCFPRGKYNSNTLEILRLNNIKFSCNTKRGYFSSKLNFLEINRFPPPNSIVELNSIIKKREGKLTFFERCINKIFKIINSID